MTFDYYAGAGADPLVDYVGEIEYPAETIRIYEWRGLMSVVAALVPLRPETRWLDFGCGTGGLVRHCRNALGVDSRRVAWRRLGFKTQLINMYGTTETTGIVSTYEIPDVVDATTAIPIGRPIDAHVRWLRAGKWISIEDLFAIDEKSKDYNEGEHQGTFYAESWALAHYLMYGRPAGQARGAGFLAQFPQRAGLQDVLKPFLGPDWGELEARLVEYVRRGRFNESLIDLDDLRVDARAETAPMTRAEALCRLGDYLAHGQPERAGDAQAYYQAAIRIDASHAAAYSGLGFLRDLQKRPDDAAGYFEKAISLQPDDPLTLFLYAENLVERFTPSGTIVRRWAGDTPPELVRARELYRKSIRLRPDVAEAYAGLGLTYIFDEGDLTAGIEALEKARLLLPSRMDVVINLVGLYARSGEVSKARDLVDRVLARSGHPQELEAGRELLLESELKTAQTLADKGDVDAALKILKAVMAGTRDAALRKTLAEQIDGVERTREHNRQIQIYNQAVTLANGRDYRKAAALLEDLVKVADDPKLADMTRQLLTQVRQAIAAGRRP